MFNLGILQRHKLLLPIPINERPALNLTPISATPEVVGEVLNNHDDETILGHNDPI